jgi:uncharacterized protein (TIGR03437 family)
MKKPMCLFDTVRRLHFTTLGLFLLATTSYAQSYEVSLSWRAIGTTLIFNSRAGLSSGPVSAVWFSPDATALEVELPGGKLYRTTDFETWAPIPRSGPHAAPQSKIVDTLPEPGARAYAAPGSAYRAYAAGRSLWRSDDAGKHWSNLVASGDTQLIGQNVLALSIAPSDPDRLAVVTSEGLWLSTDGGASWLSLNAGLPTLNLTRLIAAPQGGRGLIAEWQNSELVEWLPGAKAAWLARGNAAPARQSLRWLDAARASTRLEVRTSDRPRLYRTLNDGTQWDDLTSDLPAQQILGLTADHTSGAIYLATELGVYYTLNNLEVSSGPTSWVRLGGNLPRAAALDVLLNEGGNFLYASITGEGVFLTYAPHRRRSPALISAGDLTSRAASPGSLMSVVGLKLSQAQIAGRSLPILSANNDETQLQIPYDAAIPSPAIELNSATGATLRLDLDLADTAPVIFTDRDGAPLVLDAETGELLDPSRPLRAGMRIQILATGLGRVEPSWPAGVAAPAQNSPRVVAPVRVWLNGQTLELSKAELASGYVGFYAIETKLPPVLDDAIAELRIEAAGRFSNTIQVRTSLQ